MTAGSTAAASGRRLAVLLGEVLTWPLLLATILILGGVRLAQSKARPQATPKQHDGGMVP